MSKLAEEKKKDHRNFYSLNRRAGKGQKHQGKRMANRKYKIKQEKSLQKISVITIHINTVTSQFKQSSTTGFLQGKFLKQTIHMKFEN